MYGVYYTDLIKNCYSRTISYFRVLFPCSNFNEEFKTVNLFIFCFHNCMCASKHVFLTQLNWSIKTENKGMAVDARILRKIIFQETNSFLIKVLSDFTIVKVKLLIFSGFWWHSPMLMHQCCLFIIFWEKNEFLCCSFFTFPIQCFISIAALSGPTAQCERTSGTPGRWKRTSYAPTERASATRTARCRFGSTSTHRWSSPGQLAGTACWCSQGEKRYSEIFDFTSVGSR